MAARDKLIAWQINFIRISEIGFLLLDIPRYIDKHRARPPCLSNIESLLNRPCQFFSFSDKVIMFGDGKRNASNVCLLKGIFTDKRSSYLTSYGYYGGGIHISIGNSGYQIGG